MPQKNKTTIPQGIGHVTAKKMYDYVIRHSGGTFTALGTPMNLQFGFVVSLDPERSVTIPLKEFSPTSLTVFALNNQNYMLEYNTDNPLPNHGFKMIGAWVKDEEVVLDVVTIIATRNINQVMYLARQHGQEAVWDFSTRKALDVEQYFKAP